MTRGISLPRLPHYADNSLVNLMESVRRGFGGGRTDFAPLTLLSEAEVADARTVVLFVVDGLGYHAFRKHLQRLSSGLRGSITSVCPTSTAPAITTLLTGLAPAQHGITGWFMHLSELSSVAAILPFRSRPAKLDLAKAGAEVAPLLGGRPFFDALPVESICVAPESIIDSAFNRAVSGNAKRIGHSSLSDCVTKVEQIVRDAKHRQYVYAYWPQYDALAHEHGYQSRVALRELKQISKSIRRLVDSLKDQNALLIVTADHGFIDVDDRGVCRIEDHPELAACLSLPLCGEPRLAYCYVHPHARPRFCAYVTEHLAQHFECIERENALAQGWFGPGFQDPRLADRIGDYLLGPKGNSVIVDRLPSEERWRQRGVHGGFSEQELLVPLFVFRGR